jgi:TonB family protein
MIPSLLFSTLLMLQSDPADDWQALKHQAEVRLDESPDDAAAWFELGRAQVAFNDIKGLKGTLLRLMVLDPLRMVKLYDQPGTLEVLSEGRAPKRLVSIQETRASQLPGARPYPAEALKKKIQGDVLLEVWIDEKGEPGEVWCLWGPSELRQDAIDNIRRWRFHPVLQDDVAVRVRLRMVMEYKNGDKKTYQHLPKELRPK